MPIPLSRYASLLLCMAGVLIAALLAVLPVSVHFADDPLLRLRRLDPQLSSPGATADCGSPVRSLAAEPKSTDLFDVARANACQRAAERRVRVGLAAGAILVMVGLLGRVASSQAQRAPARP